MEVKYGKTICIYSTKGGVGKTTLTLSLAGIYATMKKKVLIVDLDLYSGGIGLALNVNQEKDIYNLVDDLNNNRFEQFDDYICKYNDYIDVLCSPKDPRLGNKVDSKYVDLVIARAEQRYDIILVDTMHVIDEIVLSILDTSYRNVLVMINDPFNLKNMKSFVSILKDNEKNNFKVVVNDALSITKNYFSNFDIKSVIKAPVDLQLSKKFYMKDMDHYIMEGIIPTLTNTGKLKTDADTKALQKFALELLEEDGDTHE